MAAKLSFSIGDLQQGAKGLNASETVERVESKADASDKADALKSLEDVYNDHNGDLDAIFRELNANPTKAKKSHNRPRDAEEFARKYYEGFYSMVEDEMEADSKASRK